MDTVSILKCSAALKQALDRDALTSIEDLAEGEAENRILIQALAERLLQLEGELADISAKARAAREAEALWQLAMRARSMAVFVNQAGEVAILPAHLVDVLAAGRAADVQVRIEKGIVTLDDERGSRSSVPMSFFINLGRLLKLWDSAMGPGSSSCSSKTGVTS